GTAGVKNGAAVDEIAGVALVGVHGGIERRAPTAVDDADGGLGIAAGGDRPDDVSQIRGVDVFVDDDDETAVIIAGAGTERGDAGLLCVAVIALLDRNDDERCAAGGGGSADVTPHSLDIWNVGLVEVIPDCRGAYGNAERNKGRLHRRRAGENRIIAIIELLDANDRFVGCAVSIVARPLAEGPFRLNLFAWRRNFTFDGDLRCRRDRQPGHVAADDIDRRSA